MNRRDHAASIRANLTADVRPANPLRYCGECQQHRRGSKDDASLCSHCQRPLPSAQHSRRD